MRTLITGASGLLGGYLLRELANRSGQVTAWSGSRTGELGGIPWRTVDLTQADVVADAFRQARPEVVIHAAALSSLAACYHDPQRAQRVNAQGTALLAELATATGAKLLQISTDLVFDGKRGWYAEGDPPLPLSVYGQSKVAAEQAALAAPRGVVARVSLLFGPALTGRPAFFDAQVEAFRIRRVVTCFADEWRTPLDLRTAARALLALAQSDFEGLLHIGGPERLSRLDMGLRLADFLKADAQLIVAASRNQASAPEPRPCDTSLSSTRWRSLFTDQPWPAWQEALAAMMPQGHP